jgi:hypothetical protein
MKRSTLTRVPLKRRQICRFDSMTEGRCHARAEVELTITSYPTGRRPLTSASPLCERHADRITGWYEREWTAHPELFEA